MMRKAAPCGLLGSIGSPLRALALLVGIAAALVAAGCAEEDDAAGKSFAPGHKGVLTVATAFLPAPGFWQGDPATSGGFEAGLASALAKRLGLDEVKVVQVSFEDITHGRLHGADLALSQLTPTSEREKVLDFSDPYLESPPGVLALKAVQGSDAKELRSLRWVASRLSTLTPVLDAEIRPDTPTLFVDDRTEALQALESGRAEALLLDLPVALGLAADDPARYHVLGQLESEHDLAAALPNASPNREIVSSEIRHLQADGTIDDLARRWLGSVGDDVPLILTDP
jgi:polar amino acid transport system substrate-binding protein